MEKFIIILIIYFVVSYIVYAILDYLYVKKGNPLKTWSESEIIFFSIIWPLPLITFIFLSPYCLINWIIKNK